MFRYLFSYWKTFKLGDFRFEDFKLGAPKFVPYIRKFEDFLNLKFSINI